MPWTQIAENNTYASNAQWIWIVYVCMYVWEYFQKVKRIDTAYFYIIPPTIANISSNAADLTFSLCCTYAHTPHARTHAAGFLRKAAISRCRSLASGQVQYLWVAAAFYHLSLTKVINVSGPVPVNPTTLHIMSAAVTVGPAGCLSLTDEPWLSGGRTQKRASRLALLILDLSRFKQVCLYAYSHQKYPGQVWNARVPNSHNSVVLYLYPSSGCMCRTTYVVQCSVAQRNSS